MQIFGLHWMMQKVRFFNDCDALKASQRHLKANVLHHPVQAKHLNFCSYIYVEYYQSNMPYNLITKPPYKIVYFYLKQECWNGQTAKPLHTM